MPEELPICALCGLAIDEGERFMTPTDPTADALALLFGTSPELPVPTEPPTHAAGVCIRALGRRLTALETRVMRMRL